MNKPNIFKYATSELSQDAIICYMLEWAKIENKALSENLYNLGVKFINSLFDNFNKIDKPEKYHKIEIKKQYKNIDVLCIINDEYSIIIEDKTNTKNHSDQLKRYFDVIKKDFSNTKILPIYFKTGDQSNYEDIKENGYSIYSRKDFLNVLNSQNYKNDVIENYTDYLQNLDDSVNSYKILPIEEWHYNSWKGFFIELKKKLKDGNWDYVSNPNGGFLGFWWNLNSNNEYKIYLQIDHSIRKITFKLQTKIGTKVEKTIIDIWKKHIVTDKDGIKVKKPKVVRAGKSVTIGILENEFRMTDNKNIVDMYKTIEFIRRVEKIKSDKFVSVPQIV